MGKLPSLLNDWFEFDVSHVTVQRHNQALVLADQILGGSSGLLTLTFQLTTANLLVSPGRKAEEL